MKESLRKRAESLALSFYKKKKYYCSESVFLALNECLELGLSQDQSVGLMAGFPVGIGGNGCLCGALSGATAALGLALSKSRSRPEIRRACDGLYKKFKENNKYTCCKLIIKPFKSDKKENFRQCMHITVGTVLLTMDILEEQMDKNDKE